MDQNHRQYSKLSRKLLTEGTADTVAAVDNTIAFNYKAVLCDDFRADNKNSPQTGSSTYLCPLGESTELLYVNKHMCSSYYTFI